MNTIREVTVGLVQIGENFNNQYYLPYSVGLLHAYAQKKLKNYGDYYFLPTLYKKLQLEKIVLYFEGVNIVFFSAYMWNFNFSLEIAKRIKFNNPDCFIVFGGPQIPEDPRAMEFFLRKYPFVNLACFGEGEKPFVEILENFQEKAWSQVSSIGYIKPDNHFIKNSKAEIIFDLNQIPSPYLDGIFESLISANSKESWSAMFETNRGCPFRCSYCAWGSESKSRVCKYDMNRIFEELDWFSKNRIEFVFCCDANFGLFEERDMQIVDRVVENNKKFGYPKAFSVQSTKNATRTIFELQRKLNSSGLQKGVNLALQSVNKQTLKSVNRDNISAEQFQELQKMFNDAGIATFSDMILGLPDESYDTFANGISNIIEGGQHNRIQFINLAVLENTEMASREYIDKFGLILQESKMVSHHTSIETENEISEKQILVIGTKTMPKKEWVRTRSFSWMAALLYFDKLLQIPFIVLNRIYSTQYRQLIEQFLIQDKRYPIVSEIFELFNKKALSIQSGDIEFIPSKDWLNIYWPADEFLFIKLCVENNLLKFYEEAKNIIFHNLEISGIKISEDIINDAFIANFELIKKPFVKEDKKLKLNYNMLEFYRSVLMVKDVPLKKGDFCYKIMSSQYSWDSWSDWCKEVVWFGTKKGDYLYSFLNHENLNA